MSRGAVTRLASVVVVPRRRWNATARAASSGFALRNDAPPPPWTWMSTKPGTTVSPVDVPPGPTAAMRSPATSTHPGSRTRVGVTIRAPSRSTVMGRAPHRGPAWRAPRRQQGDGGGEPVGERRDGLVPDGHGVRVALADACGDEQPPVNQRRARDASPHRQEQHVALVAGGAEGRLGQRAGPPSHGTRRRDAVQGWRTTDLAR